MSASICKHEIAVRNPLQHSACFRLKKQKQRFEVCPTTCSRFFSWSSKSSRVSIFFTRGLAEAGIRLVAKRWHGHSLQTEPGMKRKVHSRRERSRINLKYDTMPRKAETITMVIQTRTKLCCRGRNSHLLQRKEQRKRIDAADCFLPQITLTVWCLAKKLRARLRGVCIQGRSETGSANVDWIRPGPARNCQMRSPITTAGSKCCQCALSIPRDCNDSFPRPQTSLVEEIKHWFVFALAHKVCALARFQNQKVFLWSVSFHIMIHSMNDSNGAEMGGRRQSTRQTVLFR